MCNEVISNADIDCRITLVGNEFDQRHIRVVSSNGAKRFADERNIQYIETLASDSTNVEQAFQNLIVDIYQH
ncbi:unnamed protein product [Rotaria sordida]|uniref:Uncharacterized protein n=1 Tax=Rotaria sordida TaxID=392033 RepID=A0A815IC54_9BILA|nr:unnamed protein product [Rotaria sordida]